MPSDIELSQKSERNRWPSLPRPDIKPPFGWSLSLITSVHRIRNHSLSPDGKKIAFIWDIDEQSDVYVMDSDGGWPARFSTDRPATQYWWDEVPQWSPDNNWLALGIAGHVYVTPITGGLPRLISDFTSGAFNPVWMPDSNRLIVGVERKETNQLVLTDRDGNWPRGLTSGLSNYGDAQPSPDGAWLLCVESPLDDLNRTDVCLIDINTLQKITLAGKPAEQCWSPRWSPDGKTVAFLSETSGFNEIWLVDPGGSNLRQLTHTEHNLSEFSWSPDGKSFAATINRGGAWDLVLVDALTGTVTDLDSGLGVHERPNWSPDGKFLTVEYQSQVVPPDLYRYVLDTKAWIQLTFSCPPALACLDMVVPEQVSYRSSDGMRIPALLFKPRKSNGAAIVYPHGGPRDQYIYEWDVYMQYLVAKGYTILCVNYRGSTGFGKMFEHANDDDWGLGDTQDCLSGASFLGGLDDIDPQRIAIMGASYGGYLVACCLTRDPQYRFACGVNLFGDADLISSWAQCDRETRLYTEMQIGHPAYNYQVYRDGTLIDQVDNVKKPVLILHGLEDLVVPMASSEEWVEALKRGDKAYEYHTYAGESHGFVRRVNVMDGYARIERFLDWYLLPFTMDFEAINGNDKDIPV